VQRLGIGDVVLIDHPEQGGEVEATVARETIEQSGLCASRCECRGTKTS
jgi:hypothetical protein